jgi:hypothetical protein
VAYGIKPLLDRGINGRGETVVFPELAESQLNPPLVTDMRQAFHDITTGNNTVQFPPTTITGYQAAPGWDPVTGWGSPDAQVLVPLLAHYGRPG